MKWKYLTVLTLVLFVMFYFYYFLRQATKKKPKLQRKNALMPGEIDQIMKNFHENKEKFLRYYKSNKKEISLSEFEQK